MATETAEPQRETQFHDLNFELQEKIFSFIDNKVQLQKSREVCKVWNKIISQSFGIKLVLNNINYNLLYTSHNAIEIEMDSMTRPINETQIASLHCLRTLIFRNMLISYNLIPFLQSATNLNEVKCYEAIIDLPHELIEIPQISLNNIQKMYFRYWNLGTSLITILCCLTKMQFTKLKEIQVDTGTSFTPLISFQRVFEEPAAHEDLSAIHPLVRLIIQNLASIELFMYGSLFCPIRFKFYPVNSADRFLGPRNLPDQRRQSIPQLEELEISHIFRAEFVPILATQTKLKVLDLGCCKVESWVGTRDCIVANAKTLEKVILKSRAFGQEWSCDVFARTSVLEELILNMYTSPKTNLHFLPLSLKKLELDGIIQKEELVEIFNLRNLEELKLLSLGINLINVIPNDTDLHQQIDLNLMKMFIINLPKLILLSFKDCTANSLDWNSISNWIHEHGQPEFSIRTEFHFYDAQGQPVMHGFTMTLPKNLDRGAIAIGIDQSVVENVIHPNEQPNLTVGQWIVSLF